MALRKITYGKEPLPSIGYCNEPSRNEKKEKMK
jgi:hypothetical protein